MRASGLNVVERGCQLGTDRGERKQMKENQMKENTDLYALPGCYKPPGCYKLSSQIGRASHANQGIK